MLTSKRISKRQRAALLWNAAIRQRPDRFYEEVRRVICSVRAPTERRGYNPDEDRLLEH
jgi:hypothetical protein